MTPDEFRRLALSLPGAEGNSHLGNPDFRVKGKIFATMGGATGRPVVKFHPEEQALLTEAEPTIFSPVAGRWGGFGWTHLELSKLDVATARDALERSRRNVTQPEKRPRTAKEPANSQTP